MLSHFVLCSRLMSYVVVFDTGLTKKCLRVQIECVRFFEKKVIRHTIQCERDDYPGTIGHPNRHLGRSHVMLNQMIDLMSGEITFSTGIGNI